MKELVALLREVSNQWGKETVVAILRELDSYPIAWTGELRASIGYTQDKDGEIDFGMSSYGKFVDEGTGIFGPSKTKIPKSSIPGMAYFLRPWATSKGLNPWAVATSIVNNGGIKPRPFYKSVIAQRIPELERLIARAYKEYLDDLGNI